MEHLPTLPELSTTDVKTPEEPKTEEKKLTGRGRGRRIKRPDDDRNSPKTGSDTRPRDDDEQLLPPSPNDQLSQLRFTPQGTKPRASAEIPAPPSPQKRGSVDGIAKLSLEEANLGQFHDALEQKVEAGIKPEEHEGKRGSLRGYRGMSPLQTEQMIFRTRPDVAYGKQGSAGQTVPLASNYFVLQQRDGWVLHQHRVDFVPEQDNERVRKFLVRTVAEKLGSPGHIFDGTLLYTPVNLGEQKVEAVKKVGESTETVTVVLRHVNEIQQGMPVYTQFYNLTLRRCLFGMGLEQIGRNFFDPEAAINIPSHKLTLWPGFITSMRKHEKNVLLGVEVSHKVIRSDSVLYNINALRSNRDFQKAVEDEILNSVVLTVYNRKTYSVDGVAWNLSPKNTFEQRGTPITYADYYKSKYNVQINDMDQPLLLVHSREKDKRDKFRAVTAPETLYLVPELCQCTGLTDAMRSNFTLMKDLAKYLHMDPAGRVSEIQGFMKRLQSTPKVMDELKKWEISFASNLVPVDGRILPREKIVFAGPKPPEDVNDKADWTMAFRTRQMLKTIPLDNWLIIVPARDFPNVDNLVQTMMKVARPLNFNIKKPLDIVKVQDIRITAFINTLEEAYKKYKKDLQLVFVILPNNKLELYAAVKQKLSLYYGAISQCFLSKNVTAKGLMSIATKVVIQMNAKLGGEPWSIPMPLKKTMFIGFDVNKTGKGSKASGIGALVASTTSTLATYFSVISKHTDLQELSRNMAANTVDALRAYFETNNELPERIIFYRDGVGEGQLKYVYETELKQILSSLKNLYAERGMIEPKFTFIVVTKRVDTRLFSRATGQRPGNPIPGTVVDDIVTLPDSLDFFLISTTARQGTVSPCCFNILYDTQALDIDKIQRITYKMCHMYFNWSGTVAVPAPCQYAHKLAFLAGTAIGDKPHPALQHNLHFL